MGKSVLLLVALTILCEGRMAIPGLDGLHFDVEPHILSAWDANYQSVATQFLDLIKGIRTIAAPAGLATSFDINCDLDGEQCPPSCSLTYGGKTQSVAAHVIEQADWVTLMAYFNDTAAITKHIQFEVTKSVGVGKPVVVGVNLGPSTSPSETMREEGIGFMEQVFTNLRSGFNLTTKQMRFAIHHYGYWLAFNPGTIPSTAKTSRDIYWWCSGSSTDCDIYDDAAVTKLLNFCKTHSVSAVYIDAPAIVKLSPPTGDQAILVKLIKDLAAEGVRSHLIFGDASWALTANHETAFALARAAVKMVNYYAENVTDDGSYTPPDVPEGGGGGASSVSVGGLPLFFLLGYLFSLVQQANNN